MGREGPAFFGVSHGDFATKYTNVANSDDWTHDSLVARNLKYVFPVQRTTFLSRYTVDSTAV